MSKEIIQNLTDLGAYLKAIVDKTLTAEENERWELVFLQAKAQNAWFTLENITLAFNSWSNALESSKVEQWLTDLEVTNKPQKVGIIGAGNIPLVALHDCISVLISGHSLVFKPSSSDLVLMKAVLEYMAKQFSIWSEKVEVAEEKLGKVDALIATGSNNTARYFEYYFKDHPKLIRKNRTSVAIIDGTETEEELRLLGQDMLSYFGLGCRNVSKILWPIDYEFQQFFEAIQPLGDVHNHNKYANNYDYNRAIYLLDNIKFLDNNFLMLKEDKSLFSPLSVIFWEAYSNEKQVEDFLIDNAFQIQAVIGHNHIPFGQSQAPELWDYADGVNTLEFLKSLG